MHLTTEELWRKLRNDNNPLADTLDQILESGSEELAHAVQELRHEQQAADDLRGDFYAAESVIADKLVEIDALKASLALSNRIGQALTKRRSKTK